MRNVSLQTVLVLRVSRLMREHFPRFVNWVLKVSCFLCFRKDLPMLDTLRIGIPSIHHGGLETASYCFYWSTKFSLQDFPSLSFVEIGDFCFSNATVCLLESSTRFIHLVIELPLLSSFTAGSYSFGGLNDSYSKKVARFNSSWLTSLLRDVPSLSLVSIGPKAFYYFYELVFTRFHFCFVLIIEIGSFEDFSIESDSFFCLKVVSCNYSLFLLSL